MEERTKENKPLDNYFIWTFKKWYYWLICLLWTFWSADNEIFFSEYVGMFISTMILVGLFFLIGYLNRRSVYKKLGKL